MMNSPLFKSPNNEGPVEIVLVNCLPAMPTCGRCGGKAKGGGENVGLSKVRGPHSCLLLSTKPSKSFLPLPKCSDYF